MITHDALSRQNRSQGTFEGLGGISGERGQGRGGLHGLGKVGDELAGQLRIGEKIGDVVASGAKSHDGIE